MITSTHKSVDALYINKDQLSIMEDKTAFTTARKTVQCVGINLERNV